MFTSGEAILKTEYAGKKHVVTMHQYEFEKGIPCDDFLEKNRYKKKTMSLTLKRITVGDAHIPWLPDPLDILVADSNSSHRKMYQMMLTELKRHHRILVHQSGFTTYRQNIEWGPPVLWLKNRHITKANWDFEDYDTLVARYPRDFVIDPVWYDSNGRWISSEPLYLAREDLKALTVGHVQN